MYSVKRLTAAFLADAMHATGLGALWRRRAGRSLVVLCYHRVLPESDLENFPLAELAVTPAALESHVAYCRRHYECVPLHEAVTRLRSADHQTKPLLSFTFDDGCWDNFTHARPILNAHGVQATFFVVTSLVGSDTALWHDRMGRAAMHLTSAGALPSPDRMKTDDEAARWITQQYCCGNGVSAGQLVLHAKSLCEPLRSEVANRMARMAQAAGWPADARDRIMSRAELIQLAADGHEIGSHTRSHPLLTRLTPGQLVEEVEGSKDDLEKILGRQVSSFCYPNGDFNDDVVRATLQAGYQQAVTTVYGLNGAAADFLRLHRVFISQRRLSRANGSCSTSLLNLELTGLAETLFLRRLRKVKVY